MSVADRLAPAFRCNYQKASIAADPVAAAEPLIHFESADPFYPDQGIPACVRQAIMEKLDDQSAAHYPPLTGDSGLKETLAKRLNEKYHANVDPERNILVIPGAELGLVAALTAFLQQGDELLIPDPSYASYFQAAQLLEAKAVSVPLRQETDFAGAVSDFSDRMTSKTKAAILAQPNNPTGTVFSSEFLSEFCTCVVEKDLLLLCDMVFDDLVYDQQPCTWPALCPGMWERTVSLFSVSKGQALTGLRVGFMVASEEMIQAIVNTFLPVNCSVSLLMQSAAKAILDNKTLYESYRQKLQARRDKTCAALAKVPGISFPIPAGGTQFWIDVSKLGSAAEVAAYLRQKGIFVGAGDSMGPINGAGHIRMVFACINDEIAYENALERFCRALREHPNQPVSE
ncbi:MAG: pyridoxal phosphate-dependent aminotransferase [Faecalibacterium prausnitzii]|nr:pyridoxal phosphate-dependent aminotransferase [Faecalibacterium prausnitzii]